jgi:uncharacterized protein with von Willebrand factor type A (vWA) domain
MKCRKHKELVTAECPDCLVLKNNDLSQRITKALGRLEPLAAEYAPYGDIDNPETTQENNQTLRELSAAIMDLKGKEHNLPQARSTKFSEKRRGS